MHPPEAPAPQEPGLIDWVTRSCRSRSLQRWSSCVRPAAAASGSALIGLTAALAPASRDAALSSMTPTSSTLTAQPVPASTLASSAWSRPRTASGFERLRSCALADLRAPLPFAERAYAI
jgi:hypothetical protein